MQSEVGSERMLGNHNNPKKKRAVTSRGRRFSGQWFMAPSGTQWHPPASPAFASVFRRNWVLATARHEGGASRVTAGAGSIHGNGSILAQTEAEQL